MKNIDVSDDMEKQRFSGPVMVTMKGPPCSGKSTLAQSIAKTLKYLLIAQDDCIKELQSIAIEHLYDLSFGIICQIAASQLRLGHKVIIDASLHLRSYQERLLELSDSIGARLVIVECKPRDKFVWQQRLIQGAEVEGKSCYKPSTWEDLERLVESYDHDIADTSKLVVDTTGHIRDWDLTSGVKYLASCQGSRHMDLHEWANDIWPQVDNDLWKQTEGEAEDHDTFGEEEDEEQKFHLHQLVLLTNKPVNDDEETCRGCLEPISAPSYYKCSGCSLSVHKSCAELPHKKELVPNHCPRGYSFPEKHRCDSCENGDQDYDQCPECLFETNLRCAILPSVLLHNCHQHPLCIKTYPISFEYEFKCKACGDLGKHISYHCECGFVIHPSCALLPHTFKHIYHKHYLSLTSILQYDDSDEFYCNACEKKRNPNHWIYYCENCDFCCHLNCRTIGA